MPWSETRRMDERARFVLEALEGWGYQAVAKGSRGCAANAPARGRVSVHVPNAALLLT